MTKNLGVLLSRACRLGTRTAFLGVLLVTCLLLVTQLNVLHHGSTSNLFRRQVVMQAGGNKTETGNTGRISPSPSESAKITGTTPLAPMSSRHVIGRMRMSGGRLGNEMFVYASVLGIANRNRMLPAYRSNLLKATFQMTADETSIGETGAGSSALVETSAFRCDSRFERLRDVGGGGGDVTVIGFFQSWKYFRDITQRVRSDFRFRPEFESVAVDFLRGVANDRRLPIYPSAADDDLASPPVYIGVHIRRTDMLATYNVQRGYTVANEAYLSAAVDYMSGRFADRRLVFVVCSDDMAWSRPIFDDIVSAAEKARSNWTHASTSAGGLSGRRGVYEWLKAKASSAFGGGDIASGEKQQLESVLTSTGSSPVPSNSSSLAVVEQLLQDDNRTRALIGNTSTDASTLQQSQQQQKQLWNGNATASSSVPPAQTVQKQPPNSPVPSMIAVYSNGHTGTQDLAILAACNHTIMTVGTYGWWAGYLAGGTTLYYHYYPAAKSELDRWFSRDDFFPPEWIGL